MLVAYLDEFGHIGPYVGPDDPRHKTHPVFGYAGVVLPAEGVRKMGGLFEFLKVKLDEEIKQFQHHHNQWEKKGAALLTSQNHSRYGREIRPALGRLSKRLSSVGGEVVYFGQEKPIGTAELTGETASSRSEHMLITAVRHVCQLAAERNEKVMVFLDSVDDTPRKQAVSVMGGFIYSTREKNLQRIVEVPMQLESKHYGMVQYADWICALLSRASHFHLVPESEFGWAPGVLRQNVANNVVLSKLSYVQRRRDLGPGMRNLKTTELVSDIPWHETTASRQSRSTATKRTGPLTETVASSNAAVLAQVYAAAKSKR